tara:strand:+ start:960 stop:1370 length:411 start_codon:yes stop_codon:yes gene_type:complete
MIDKEIIKIASNTENHGVLDNHTHSSKLKNSICGDDMKIYLIVKEDKIINLKYECESCIYCQASVSLLSRNAKNKLIENFKNFTRQATNSFENNTNSFDKEWKEFGKILNEKNVSRKECLLLPLNTTLDALNKKSL